MDAALGSRETLKTILDHHCGSMETSFSLNNEFIWKDNKKIVVKVVAIMADATKVNEIFRKCIDIFTDAALVGLGNKELIPFPRKGVMAPEPHHNTILEHYNYCKTNAAILITGRFFKKNTNMIPTRSNSQHIQTIQSMLLEEITDANGVPYFTSLEQTKFSAMEGCYLLFTQKEKATEAIKTRQHVTGTLYLPEHETPPDPYLNRPKDCELCCKDGREIFIPPPPHRAQFAIPVPPSNQDQTYRDVCHFHRRQ